MFRAGSSTARRGGSEVHPAKWRLGRKFQSVPAAPQPRRSIGDRVEFGPPPRQSEIEDGKSGDTVGAVRSVHFRGTHIRQRLLAQSDVERSQTRILRAPALPV